MIRGIQRKQKDRDIIITGSSGAKYEGKLVAGENAFLRSDMRVLKNPNKSLREILEDENGNIVIDSKFKSIDIRDISEDYRYIGGKKECAEYINRILNTNQKEVYVDKTVRREYKLSEIPDAIFAPGFQRVKY